MHITSKIIKTAKKALRKRFIYIAAILFFTFGISGIAQAVSSWNPTLIVNTESFNVIDSGDGTTDIELRFGTSGNNKLQWNLNATRFQFTSNLLVGGNLSATGAIAASGAISADGNITINADAGAANAVLTFGNDAGNETLQFNDTTNEFDLSDDINVTGTLDASSNISGSGVLSVEGASSLQGAVTLGSTLRINGVTYTFPYSDGTASGKVLKTDGAGNLVWATDTDTQLTQEQVEDYAGAAATGNTETLITVTYQDADGTVDYVVDNDLANYSWTNVDDSEIPDAITVTGYMQDEDINTFSELDTWVTDATLLKGGTLTDAKICRYESSTGEIDCDYTDQTGGSALSSTGALQTVFDSRYVNTSGDTMTGALKVRGSLSGTTLRVDGNSEIWGALAVSGALTTDGNATINVDNTGADAVLTFGNDAGAETLTFSDSTNQFEMSDDLKTSGNFESDGNGTFQGTLEINDDNTGDATLTFGNDAGDETLKFNDTTNEFDLSDDINVTGTVDVSSNLSASGVLSVESNILSSGNISGSTLTVDGNVTVRGRTYAFPTTAGARGQVLTTDGSGNLTWSGSALGLGSGGVVALSPEYPNAVYTNSGTVTNKIGQLSYDFDATNKENYYRWTSTNSSLQEYWIVARVRIPDNFKQWDSARPIQFRYRTGDSSSANNFLTMRLYGTDGNQVALTGGGDLANTSWTTATVTGPASAGVYAPGSYITVAVKLVSNSTGSADAGFINLNFETTAP